MSSAGDAAAAREANGVIAGLTNYGWFGAYHDFAPVAETGSAVWRAVTDGFGRNTGDFLDYAVGDHYGWKRFGWPTGECFCHRADDRYYVPGWPPRVARMKPWEDAIIEERNQCSADSCDPVNIHLVWALAPDRLHVLASAAFERGAGATLSVNGRRLVMRHVELASFVFTAGEPSWVEVEQRWWRGLELLER